MKKLILSTSLIIIALFLYGCQTEDRVSVTLYLEGEQLGDKIEINKGDNLLVPCASKEGYTLDGWYRSSDGGKTFEDKWLFEENEVLEDLSLYAIWVPNN